MTKENALAKHSELLPWSVRDCETARQCDKDGYKSSVSCKKFRTKFAMGKGRVKLGVSISGLQ